MPVWDTSEVQALRPPISQLYTIIFPDCFHFVYELPASYLCPQTHNLTSHPLNIDPFVSLFVEKSLKNIWKQRYRICKTRIIAKQRSRILVFKATNHPLNGKSVITTWFWVGWVNYRKEPCNRSTVLKKSTNKTDQDKILTRGKQQLNYFSHFKLDLILFFQTTF